MSTGALGSFAQGLVQGYRIGDEMKTAESKRKYVDQQTALDAQKTAMYQNQMERQKKVDAAGDELAAAVKDIMPGPDGTIPGGAIQDPEKENQRVARWQNAYTNYIAIAKPEALNQLRIQNKEEVLGDWARGVSKTVAGLMNKDPAAIPAAAKLYNQVPDGFDIDPTQSGYDKDGNINFAVRNKETGAVQMVTRSAQDIHKLAFHGLLRPDQILSQFNADRTAAENERYHRDTVDARREGNALHAASIAEQRAGRLQQRQDTQALREEEMWQKFTLGQEGLMNSILGPKVDEIKNSTNYDFSPEKKAAAIRDLENRRAIAGTALNLNSQLRFRASAADLLQGAEAYQKGALQLAPVPDGNGGFRTDIGRLPSGAYFPIPPGMKLQK